MIILITGGSGFIGSNLIKLAISRGHKIINVDAMSYAASKESLKKLENNSNYFFENADIRNRENVDAILAKYIPETIIHLAAESHVDRSIDAPIDFIQTNITGTFNMLEAALNFWNNRGKPDNFRFQHISTDEVFGSLPSDPTILFNEDTPYNPRSPYSASKAS